MCKEEISLEEAIQRCYSCTFFDTTNKLYCTDAESVIEEIPDCNNFTCPKNCQCGDTQLNEPLRCEIIPEEMMAMLDKIEPIEPDDIISRMQKALDWSQDVYNLHRMAIDIGLTKRQIAWASDNLVCRVIKNTDAIIDTDTYSVVTWPDVQELMEEPWFREEAILDVEGKFGDSAYFIPTKYLKS